MSKGGTSTELVQHAPDMSVCVSVQHVYDPFNGTRPYEPEVKQMPELGFAQFSEL